MSDVTYLYSSNDVRNPFRNALALWRAIRNPANAYEAKLVEIGFASSRFGRRFARWRDVAETLLVDARTAARLRERRSVGPIDLDAIAQLPEQTLGRLLAEHCRSRGLNPNLIRMQPTSAEDWILNELYQTHDIWHVATGWGTDPVGEMGVGGFYIAQLHGPRFIALLIFFFMVKAVFFAPRTFAERIDALTAGYTMGKCAAPLFGLDWTELWGLPLQQVREQLHIDASRVIGDGIHIVR